MEQGVSVKDANKVIDFLTKQNAEITKINAFQNVIIQEQNEEIVELKKAIEEINKKK
ncbi:MAG TPA: hypothetical protein VEY70_19750 [Metabacillus sp.]|nr:hypothetical protein [Metabacillus sp.]